MPAVPAKVVPEQDPTKRTIFKPISMDVLPVFKGSGHTNYSCEMCRTILVKNIIHGQLRTLIIVCPKCGASNEIP
jgi:hypothetical protein